MSDSLHPWTAARASLSFTISQNLPRCWPLYHLDCLKLISLQYPSVYNDSSGIETVENWNHLSWASKSQLCGPLPNSGFSDITSVVWNQPRWEYAIEIKCYNKGFPPLFLSSFSLFWERQRAHRSCHTLITHCWVGMTWFGSMRPKEIVNQAFRKPLMTLFLWVNYKEMRSQTTEATLATIRRPVRG